MQHVLQLRRRLAPSRRRVVAATRRPPSALLRRVSARLLRLRLRRRQRLLLLLCCSRLVLLLAPAAAGGARSLLCGAILLHMRHGARWGRGGLSADAGAECLRWRCSRCRGWRGRRPRRWRRLSVRLVEQCHRVDGEAHRKGLAGQEAVVVEHDAHVTQVHAQIRDEATELAHEERLAAQKRLETLHAL
eukprot:6173409-Pleurochrysis_carterae.AAC.1